MKKVTILLLFIIILVGIMIGVNEASPTATHCFNSEACTRYCHDHECRHFTARDQEQVIPAALQRLYASNITLLQSQPFGLSYRETNLLVYIIILPFFLILGFWGIIRKGNG